MKEWIKEIQFVKQIATHLLLPRKSNYHEDFLLYKLSKNSQLRHTNFKAENQFKQILNATLIKHKQQQNDTCVIFLHGYGSNKQEGFTLIDYLPKEIDLCCFDFSSSGKSQGTITTYGLKEFRDIRAIINKLKSQQFGYNKFILWGRSMGAVASHLMICSQETIDKNLKKDIIFQVLDSPFSSFQSICSYQGKQSFKLPQPFISIGIQILKSYFKDHQFHLNPFNIDLIKISDQCTTNSLFLYSEKDNMIPKENTLSIIQKLPSSTNYEKLLIHEDHNTLRSNQTNQQVFKIITKNYLKYLYNKQKDEALKSKVQQKAMTFDLNFSQKSLKKIESEIHFHRKNIVSAIYIEHNPTQQTSNNASRKQPVKKQKKYLQLLSTAEKNKKKQSKARPQLRPFNIDIGQIHSYRNMTAKSSKILHSTKKVSNELIDNEDTYEHKNTMNSINSFKDIHKLRRSNTFDCPEGYQPIPKLTNAQSLQKPRYFDSNLSTAIKTNDLQQSLKMHNKMRKRALYCSLNKNYVSNKIGFKPSGNKNSSYTFLENDNVEDLH